MLCCDVCEGWSHLTCMGMKEGVEVMVHVKQMQGARVGQAHNKLK